MEKKGRESRGKKDMLNEQGGSTGGGEKTNPRQKISAERTVAAKSSRGKTFTLRGRGYEKGPK